MKVQAHKDHAQMQLFILSVFKTMLSKLLKWFYDQCSSSLACYTIYNHYVSFDMLHVY
jgi:hypothetical protein